MAETNDEEYLHVQIETIAIRMLSKKKNRQRSKGFDESDNCICQTQNQTNGDYQLLRELKW